jgi:hypothetical protein
MRRLIKLMPGCAKNGLIITTKRCVAGAALVAGTQTRVASTIARRNLSVSRLAGGTGPGADRGTLGRARCVGVKGHHAGSGGPSPTRFSPRCFRLSGRGGVKAAVREVDVHRAENTFVCRTNVKDYYANINHHILMRIVEQYIQDEAVLTLLWGYLRRYVSDGEDYIDITQGIVLGCPLSPLLGTLFLKPLDDRMAALGLFYVRFMDDWIILAPTRWTLRKAIKAMNEVLAGLRVEKHPDQTIIGRIARGFDFLGFWFTSTRVGLAWKTIERFVARITRLYEQGASAGRIGAYVRHWRRGYSRVGLMGVGQKSARKSSCVARRNAESTWFAPPDSSSSVLCLRAHWHARCRGVGAAIDYLQYHYAAAMLRPDRCCPAPLSHVPARWMPRSFGPPSPLLRAPLLPNSWRRGRWARCRRGCDSLPRHRPRRHPGSCAGQSPAMPREARSCRSASRSLGSQ